MKKSIALLLILVFTGFSFTSVQKVAATSTSAVTAVQTTDISESQYEENIADAKPITIEQYLKKMVNNDRFIVFIGFSDCSHCRKFSPVMKQYLQSATHPIYYLDYGQEGSFKKASQDQINQFFSSFDNGFEFMGTPTVALINKGKVVSMTVGDDTTLSDLQHISTDFNQINQ